MRLRRFVLAVAFIPLLTGRLAAQSFNLRDLLTDFLREGITLAPPPEGFPSHSAHFIGDDSPQFQAVEQLNTQIADQLSSFPLASSAGGFTYTFDTALGVFVRSSDSFGPVYAERVDTVGKGRFNLGVNYSHFTFDKINDLALKDGDLRLVFTHQDTNHNGNNETLFFEGDVITAQLSLKITTDITAVVFNYGITDRFDVGTAIPIVRVAIDARTDAAIDRLGDRHGGSRNPPLPERLGPRDLQPIRQRVRRRRRRPPRQVSADRGHEVRLGDRHGFPAAHGRRAATCWEPAPRRSGRT